ncbi:molecular chaperone TorD family protein [Photobacterium sagamiensis]|uniref:molecular chaperone TorD family protein n=1 Tax=Photobacterium sagamiensis TaxID=2910241 RepID=UPI003D11B6B6
MIAVVPRILGTLFYYSPDKEPASQMLPAVAELPEFFSWQQIETVQPLCQLAGNIAPAALIHDYSVLFEGLGDMPAPPWGSVYLNSENMVMGESTQAYRTILARESLAMDTGMNEPEDQFGLMLLALAALLEAEKSDAAAELIEHHLLPWAFRYLDLVEQAPVESPFYPMLAKITRHYLCDIQQLLALTPPTVQLYR